MNIDVPASLTQAADLGFGIGGERGQIWARGDLSGSYMQLRQVVVLTGEIPPVLHLFTEATD